MSATKEIPSEKSPQESTFKKRVRKVCKTRPHLFIIFIISIMGFCYHFQLSLRQYWQYKTTVSFAHEIPDDYHFQYPSLTVCFPDIVPHYRMAELYPEYEEAVEQIKNESIQRNDPNFWTKDESGGVNSKKMKGKYLHKFFEEKIVSNRTVLQLLEEFSYGIHDDCVLDAKPLVKNAYKMKNCEEVNQPIEAMNGDYRCFTYLSQLDTVINETNANLYRTTVFYSSSNYEQRTNRVFYVSHALNTTLRAHPFENDFRARALVHSPNSIPVPSFFPSVPLYQWSRLYDIQFTKIVSHLLQEPYATDCFPYKTGPEEELQSFDDCFAKCLIKKYRQNCRCLPRSGILYRKSLLDPEDKFCRKINKCQFTNYRLECEKGCQHDCVEEQYDFDKFADIPFYQHNNLTGLQLSRKPVLDQVYRHSPSVTFIQLICDFGGLGGLWLGFSVITITTAIIQLISKPLERIVESDE